MATNITNKQIDDAVPNLGDGTPHSEQPNRRLVNAVLKEIAQETNSLGAAASRNVGTGSGEVLTRGSFGLGSTVGTSFPKDGRWRDLRAGFYGGSDLPTSGMAALSDSQGAVLLLASDASYRGIIHMPNRSSGYTRIYACQDWYGDGTRYHNELICDGNLRSSTGQSETYPMTQKAVTDAIQGVSDRRDKTGIRPTVVGLDLIKKLNPVSYRLNKRDWYRRAEATSTVEADGETVEEVDKDTLKKPLSEYNVNDGSLARPDLYTGFIAQDLQAALEDLGMGDFGLVKNLEDEYGGDDQYFIEHTGLIAFLVKAIQELSEKVEQLERGAK